MIIDEASSITEMECLLPMIKGANKVTLFGDSYSLEPTTYL